MVEATDHVTWILAAVLAIFLGACCYGAYFLFFMEKKRPPRPVPKEMPKDTPPPTEDRTASRTSVKSAQSDILFQQLEADVPANEDIEKQPLMGRTQTRKDIRECRTMSALSMMKWQHSPTRTEDEESGDEDTFFQSARKFIQGDVEETRVINYDTATLGTWAVFTYSAGTVMQSGRLWKVMWYLMLVALGMGLLVNIYPKPQEIDPNSFRKIATFLKVFVAFLIGFYITQALATWRATVSGFLQLCNSVRNTQMALLVFGVDSEKVQTVVRYGALSVVFLTKELEFAHLKKANRLRLEEAMFDQLEEEGHITEDERNRLERIQERAELMWVWIASFLSKLSEDGEVPPMASPTFGRILQQAQGGEIGIREVHTAISIQIPFIYVHTLAALVHLNNILCAISLGLSIGISVGTLMVKFDFHPLSPGEPATVGGMPKDLGPPVQEIIVALLGQGVGPFMYTAFLQIALSLAYPFGEDSKVARIPHHHFITKLLAMCEAAKAMAEDPPMWTRPRFKKPAAPPAAAPPAAAAPVAAAASPPRI